jgi:NNP family nitrate/nitrite transporter-like MFS transporter
MMVDFTGINSTIFMLLFLVTCWSLIWMYTTEVRGVKTLQLISSTGREAEEAEQRKDAQSLDDTRFGDHP